MPPRKGRQIPPNTRLRSSSRRSVSRSGDERGRNGSAMQRALTWRRCAAPTSSIPWKKVARASSGARSARRLASAHGAAGGLAAAARSPRGTAPRSRPQKSRRRILAGQMGRRERGRMKRGVQARFEGSHDSLSPTSINSQPNVVTIEMATIGSNACELSVSRRRPSVSAC